MNLLKKLAHTTWGADRETMLKLYNATVIPILDYGCQIYSSASESALKVLNPVHHLGLRLATDAFRSSPTPSVIVDSGDLPLHYRFKSSIMCRGLKLKGSSLVKGLFNERDLFFNTRIIPPFPIRAKRLIEHYNIENIQIYNFKCNIAPWCLKKNSYLHKTK